MRPPPDDPHDPTVHARRATRGSPDCPPPAASRRIAIRLRRVGFRAACALGLLLLAVRPALAQRSDSTAFSFEVGVTTDLTNEMFYEDAFVDSVSVGRRLIDTPEARSAGVMRAGLSGVRGGGAVQYQIENELSLGDKLQRNQLGGSWRAELGPDWRMYLMPRLEYRHDETFDRDLEEWRASATARARRAFPDGATFLELLGSGDLLQSDGRGSDFLLDRRSARWGLGIERAPLFGSEWLAGCRGAWRVFPDSSDRDHLESGWEARWKRDFEGGTFLLIETEGARRWTLRPAATSRDRFWQGEGALETGLISSAGLSWQARFGIEALRYDVEDDTSFFDYRILRGRLGPRLDRGAWSFAGGPRAEMLISRDPGEEYRELGAWAEIEHLGASAWWSVSPAAGWRDYSEAELSDTTQIAGLHASFAFIELGVLADQALSSAVRLRLFASGRLEAHVDPAQNARSLYFSLDVRRLF